MNATKEQEIETQLIQKLEAFKYTYRPDIHDREALERHFREKMEKIEEHEQIANLTRDIDRAQKRHNDFLKELGLPVLP